MKDSINKIVFVNQSTGYLMTDVINAFSQRCATVSLITGRVIPNERGLDNRVFCSKIIRYNKKTLFTRILTWLVGSIQISVLLLLKYRNCHVIYVTNPPISYWASLLLGNSYSIIVYDIYPDALKNINIDSSSFIFRLWKKINQRVFSKAKHLYTLSDGMAALLSQYCRRDKIKVIPCWSGSDKLKPISKEENLFIKEHRLEGKFVVMYSGNIGYTHNVETIIRIAEKLRNIPDICFYIIGEGLKKKILMEMVKSEKLENCFFLPYQPVEMMNHSLAAADVSVVTLTAETAFVSVPSKTYNLLAVGSPLLVIAPQGSEIERLVFENECGMSFEQAEVDSMVSYIMKLKDNVVLRRKLSENSRKASRDYTFLNALQYVDTEFEY